MTQGAPPDPAFDKAQAVVVAWIEDHIGPVRAITRQGRWRPAWFVEADQGGKPIELYVRGGRGARFPPLPISYEAQVQALFAEEGLMVSRVLGFIDSVPAIVMSRLPGRPNMATAEGDDDRARLRGQLADQMARMHRIDPARVAALGAPTSGDPHEVTLLHYRAIEKLYLEGDRLPSPDIEFVRTWIERNVPACSEGAAVIAVDAGQFMFEGRDITGLVDLEHVCIGDRHVDMAALRTRNLIEEIGDLELFYDLYEQRGGIKLDRDRIAFHWVTFATIIPLQIAHNLAHPEVGINYHEYIGWHARAMTDALKDIARFSGVALEAYPMPEQQPDRMSFQLEALVKVVECLPAETEYEAYRRHDLALALANLRDHAAMRWTVEREYLDEIENLTGYRPETVWDGDVRLAEFVRTAGPEFDARILQVLYRRNERVAEIIRRHDLRRREGMESA